MTEERRVFKINQASGLWSTAKVGDRKPVRQVKFVTFINLDTTITSNPVFIRVGDDFGNLTGVQLLNSFTWDENVDIGARKVFDLGRTRQDEHIFLQQQDNGLINGILITDTEGQETYEKYSGAPGKVILVDNTGNAVFQLQPPLAYAYFRGTVAVGAPHILVPAIANKVIYLRTFVLKTEGVLAAPIIELTDTLGQIVWSSDCASIIDKMIDWNGLALPNSIGCQIVSVAALSPTFDLTLTYSQY